ncbi:MAG: hypothetical protein AABY15_03995 [Nanoarchaeota archaeon]
MIKVSKNSATDTYHALTDCKTKIPTEKYINLSGFKDDIEHDVIFRKIELMLKEWQTKPKVFG